MKKILLKIYHFDNYIGKISLKLASFFLIAIIFMVLWGVFSRIINEPSSWTNTYSVYGLIAFAYVGAAGALHKNEHVRVDILLNKMSKKTQKIVEIFTYSIAFIYVLVISILTFDLAWDSYLSGVTDLTIMRTPMYIPQMTIPIGSILLLLVIKGKIIENFCSLKGWLKD